MKKNKGFSIIELITVMTILALLFIIAVPAINRYLKRGTKEYYHSLENEIKASGMDYLETYRTLLPRQIGNVTVIDINELVSNNYIDEITDEDGNVCTGQITAKKIDSGNYEYYSCLKCGDLYITEGDNCSYTEFDNEYVDQEYYSIELEKDRYVVNQTDEFELPFGKVYYNDKLIEEKLEGSPNEVDTDILGTTKVIYYYHGAKKEITVEVIDPTKPSKPEVVLKHDDKNGTSYLPTTWYSGNIYQQFKSTDYTKPGVLGSGVKEYQISTDGVNFTKLDSDNRLDTENGIHKYYVRSVDNSNNISNVNSYSLKIDQEIPKCSLEVKSGTLGTNGWYTSNITVGFKSTTETVSSIVSTTISDPSITSNVKGKVVTGTIIDEAGNIGTCSITVYVDKTVPNPPIIAATDGISSGAWHKTNTTLTFSGANNISGNTYYYGTSSPTTAGSSYTRTTETGGTTYYSKVCSGAGLCSTNSSYLVKLDKTAPSCTDSGNYSSWTSGNRTVYYGCSDGLSLCHGSYSGGSKIVNYTATTTTIGSYSIMDNAGNWTTCPAITRNVYVDKTKPSCSISKTVTYDPNGVDGTISCSDSHSGCSSSNTTSFSNKTSGATYTVKDKVGNSNTCTLSVSTTNQYRKKECDTYEKNGLKCNYNTNSCFDPGPTLESAGDYKDYQLSGCSYIASSSSGYEGMYNCSKQCPANSCCTDWGTWGSWGSDFCLSGTYAKIICEERTVYY